MTSLNFYLYLWPFLPNKLITIIIINKNDFQPTTIEIFNQVLQKKRLDQSSSYIKKAQMRKKSDANREKVIKLKRKLGHVVFVVDPDII